MFRVGRRDRLASEITVVLTVKLIALVLIWWLFFSPSHRVAIDSSSITGHLFGAPVAASHSTQEKS